MLKFIVIGMLAVTLILYCCCVAAGLSDRDTEKMLKVRASHDSQD